LKNIETFAAELRPQIEADMKEALSRITDIRSEIENMKTGKQKFIEDLEKQATAVKQKGEELKQKIDRKVEELLEELESIKSESLNCAQAAESCLQKTVDTIQSYCEYSQEIRMKGKAHDVIRCANALHAQATDLLENRISFSDYTTAPCVMFIAANVDHSTQQMLGYISTPLSSSGLRHSYPTPKM